MDQHSSSARGGQNRPESYFYEELESAASLNQTCEIICRDDSGRESLIISRVINLYTDHGTEYARLDGQTIPLNRIMAVNGRRASGQVDTNLLEKGLQPNASPATEHHKYPEEESRLQPTVQPQIGETSMIAQAAAYHRMAGEEGTMRRDESADFVHRFTTTPPPFVVAENEFYHLSADRLANRLYMKVNRPWSHTGQVQDLGSHIARIAPLMDSGFTLLNDLTSIQPDEEGTVWAPPIPNRDALMRNGLVRVADVVSSACETLVHGIDSFSVNSVSLRYFKEYAQADHWLTNERTTLPVEGMDNSNPAGNSVYGA